MRLGFLTAHGPVMLGVVCSLMSRLNSRARMDTARCPMDPFRERARSQDFLTILSAMKCATNALMNEPYISIRHNYSIFYSYYVYLDEVIRT